MLKLKKTITAFFAIILLTSCGAPETAEAIATPATTTTTTTATEMTTAAITTTTPVTTSATTVSSDYPAITSTGNTAYTVVGNILKELPARDFQSDTTLIPIYEKTKLDPAKIPGHFKGHIIADERIYIFGNEAENTIYVSVFDKTGEFIEQTFFENDEEIDLFTESIKKPKPTEILGEKAAEALLGNPSRYNSYKGFISGCGDYDLCYVDRGVYTLINSKTGEYKKAFDTLFAPEVDSDYRGSTYGEFYPVADGVMLSFNEFTLFTDTGKREERKTIRVSVYGSSYDAHTSRSNFAAFRMFNAGQSEYAAFLIEAEEFPQDLSPDVIETRTEGTLSNFIEKSDLYDISHLLTKDNYENILKDGDGKVYSVSPFFVLDTSFVLTDIAGAESGWSTDDLLRISKEHPGVQLIDSYGFYYDGLGYISEIVLDGINFDDYKTEDGYDFDNPKFKETIDFIEAYRDYDLYDAEIGSLLYYDTQIAKIRNGRSASDFNYVRSSTLAGYTTYFGMGANISDSYFGGRDITLKGYPTSDGKNCHRPIFAFSYEYAIPINTRNMYGAIYFMTFILSKEYGETGGEFESSTGGFSVNRKANETLGAAEVGTVYEKNDGTKTTVTREDIDVFLAAFENTGYSYWTTDYEEKKTVQSEVDAYLYGNQTYNQLIKNINEKTAAGYEQQPEKPLFDIESGKVEVPIYEKIPLEAKGLPEHYQWYLVANKQIHIFGSATEDGEIDRVSVFGANGKYLRRESLPDRTDLNNYYDRFEVDNASQKAIDNALYTAQGNNFLPITTEVVPVNEGIMYSVAERAVYVDTGERKTRKLITAVSGGNDRGYTYNDIYPAIRMFNLSQDEYAAVFLLEENNKDIVPDIYMSGYFSLRDRELLDLTQFYTDEHYDWLSDYYTDYVKPFFILQTAYAYAEYAGDEPGWTVDDILRIAEENPGVQVIEGDDRHGLSTMFIEETLFDAIDLESYKKDGVYDFDNEQFRDILTHVKTYKDHDLSGMYNGYDPVMTEKIRTKESLSYFDQWNGSEFLNHTTTFSRVAILRQLYFGGEDITVKGFPSVDGKSGQFHNTFFTYTYGVNKNAPNLDGAKAFIKFILSADYGATAGDFETNRGSFSINRKANEQIAEAAIGEIGKTNDGVEYSVTREDVDDLLRALECSGIDPEGGMPYDGFRKVIQPETRKFYEDEQTLDETIANINKAVNAANE
jgi:hypothetical protein